MVTDITHNFMLYDAFMHYLKHVSEIYEGCKDPVVGMKKIKTTCRGQTKASYVVAAYLVELGLAEIFNPDDASRGKKNLNYKLRMDKIDKYLKEHP